MGKNSTRPLSPHLTIYKPQITTVLSITHRATGIALYFSAWLFAAWIIISAYSPCDCLNSFIRSGVGQAGLVLVSMALFYHLFNGIRHLFWDIGKGYSLRAVTLSGWSVIILTIVTTIIVWSAMIGINMEFITGLIS